MDETSIFQDKYNNIYFIRAISPADKENLKIGLKELSPESRRLRFKSGKNDFNDKELAQLTEVDMDNHIAFVASIEQDHKLYPAGVIRGVRDSLNINKLEIAITIIDKYQGRGLGLFLLKKLENFAVQIGYTHFIGDFHISNKKMHQLLQNFAKNREDFVITHIGDGFLYFEVCLK